MQRNHIRGILAVGIICLFVGVGIHPAFAVDTKQTMINKAVEEDCGCNEIDYRQFVVLEKQLNRLEVYTKLLLIISRYNPEFKKKVQDLSNEISTINEMYDKIETCLSYNDKPICDSLYDAHSVMYSIWDILDELADRFGDIKIFNQIFEIISYLAGVYGVVFVIIGIFFNCEWADDWPHPE